MTKFKIPTAYTILFSLIILVAVFTWIIPAGQYDYTEDKTPIAGSYHEVERNGQGVGDVILAPFSGFYDAVDVALFILMVGGFLGIIMETGAISAGIANVIRLMSGKEKWMIPILMTLFGLGGTTFGMSEETMAFYPLLIPVFIAAGYDVIVPIAVILLGAGIGVLGSTVNPFATGIAAGFADISLGVGILLRVAFVVILEALAIVFVMRYAAKVKADKTKSIVSDQWDTNKSHFAVQTEDTHLSGTQKAVLTVFAITFVVMIYGVIPFEDMGLPLPTLGWWFPELSGLFLVGGVLCGLIGRLKEEQLIDGFVRGAADLLGVAFIIGISRGITVIMNNGAITDTVLHWGEMALTGAGSFAFTLLVYLLYLPLSFLIPSTSGLATLSIPIMVPLGDFAGVGRDLVITAFQSASGLVNLITPTSAVVMGALSIGRVPYVKWIKFSWKFLIGVLLLSMILLGAGTLIG